MKKSISFMLLLSLITLAIHSCKKDSPTIDNASTPMTESIGDESSPILLLINGTVKNMRTKQVIPGVSIQGAGNNTTSRSNGSFSISFNAANPATLTYSKSGFSQLRHVYTSFNNVEEIVIYMEENAIQNQSSKSLSGTIQKRDSRGTVVDVPNIEIEAFFNGGNAMTRSNARGFYTLSFPSPTPRFDYTYGVNKKTEIANVTMQSAIKDSSDIDILFDEVVGGPPAEIDSLITQ